MKYLYLLVCIFLLCLNAKAQIIQDSMSYTKLHQQCIRTDRAGMKVLGTWAVANIAAGTAGYLIANDREWKAFHGTNALWNLVNLGLSGIGLAALRKEERANATCGDMLHAYEARKRLYLINGGLDLAYIGGGLLLMKHAPTTKEPEIWRGVGRSIAIQGVALLVFDGIMYSAHACNDKQWYKALNHICISGSSIGLRYTL